MKFIDYIALKMEGESARNLESPMRIVDVPMSKAGFTGNRIPHGEYKSKNFDRYPFKPDEAKAFQYVDKMKNLIRNDMHICIEALAGYYGNDAIVKTFDDFLTELYRQNVKF